MGLSEKKAIKDFQDKSFPTLKAEIEKIAGSPVKINVQWETLAVDGIADNCNELLTKIYFQPIINAFKSIAADNMGKDALKAGLKSVTICNVAGKYSPSGITFEDGVLQIDHQPNVNEGDIDDRTKAIETLLEKAL